MGEQKDDRNHPDSKGVRVLETPGGVAPAVDSQAKGGGLILPEQALPPNLFVIPVTRSVVFPTLMAPLIVSVPRFVATVEEAISRQRVIGLVLTREPEVAETTGPKEIYESGVAVRILKRLKMPDGSVNLLIHSIKRFRVKQVISERPHIVIEAEYRDDVTEKSNEMDALVRTIIGNVKKLSETNPFFTDEMKLAMINAPAPATVADLVAFALSPDREDAQYFLDTLEVKKRFEKLLVLLRKEQDVADLQRKIHEDVNQKISALQREYFLKEQLKVIRKELGQEEDGKEKSSRDFRSRVEESGMPEAARKALQDEVRKLETLSEQSPEYNVTRTYLETVLSLPWAKESEDKLDIGQARTILETDHFGLEKVKARIIEFLSVRKLLAETRKATAKAPAGDHQDRPRDRKGSIICLVGPPGVGKTSIGRSIAKAMGRKFFRFSLGGMRDEAEIKGHRRTYIGALPGKIVQALRRVETKNPVIMLDEIDKLGASFQGDPASALLEVLDPEQNHAFLDHYVDLPFDLSQVLFIATANTAASIPAPLLDRMELIEIPGYTLEEKEEIARRYVIPRVLESNGIQASQVRITAAALKRLMLDYAREPGMRTVQQLIERIARRAAARIVGKARPAPIVIRPEGLEGWLGPKRHFNDVAERITRPGVTVGLAWTALGGDILFIEATETPGTGALKLTGQMGDVMTESASIAWTFVKRRVAAEKGLDHSYFKDKDFHLHIPSGAIPKDGPSAGVTMAAAAYSLLTGRRAVQKVAMTGELSLIGKVLPVGGIKEKLLAANRAGIETVILPEANRKDLAEVPKEVRRKLRIRWAESVDQVFDWTLEKPVRKQPKPKRGAGRRSARAGSRDARVS